MKIKNELSEKLSKLTIEKLRNFKGFENYSDQQAEETIKSLEKLSILFYKLHRIYLEGNYLAEGMPTTE